MGLFRPTRKVRGPGGEYWELYVSKTALPGWHEGKVAWFENDSTNSLLVAAIESVWAVLLRPLLFVLFLLPVAWIRGRRSRAIRIEALSPYYPSRRVLLWTTTEGQVQAVLEEIAAGLAEGRIVHPAGAVYSGEEL